MLVPRAGADQFSLSFVARFFSDVGGGGIFSSFTFSFTLGSKVVLPGAFLLSIGRNGGDRGVDPVGETLCLGNFLWVHGSRRATLADTVSKL